MEITIKPTSMTGYSLFIVRRPDDKESLPSVSTTMPTEVATYLKQRVDADNVKVGVEVTYRDKDGNVVEDDEISRIFVASETDKAVILSIETKTKYPVAQLYSSVGCVFPTAKGNTAMVNVRNLPFDSIVIAEAGRNNLFLIVFRDVQADGRKVFG